jgi:hypothetical protein
MLLSTLTIELSGNPPLLVWSGVFSSSILWGDEQGPPLRIVRSSELFFRAWHAAGEQAA